MTSEVPRPDEPSDPQPAPESSVPGDHTPGDHGGRESAQPTVPSAEQGAAEPNRTGMPKGGCALLLALVVLVLLGVTVAPLALIVS